MNIREIFNSIEYDQQIGGYQLRKIGLHKYIGYSNEGLVCLLITAPSNKHANYIAKNSKIMMVFSQEMEFRIQNQVFQETGHIAVCLSSSEDDIGIFLDLCQFHFSSNEINANQVVDILINFSNFFSQKEGYSVQDIQGIFTELYFIKLFYECSGINISKYWHYNSIMKFDFSITNRFKIEVKSSFNLERTHYFSHEQLDSGSFDIYVISFILREDNNGTTLSELIDQMMKTMDFDSPTFKNLLGIKIKLGNTHSPNIHFDNDFITEQLKVFSANVIPKIEGGSPEGVSGITYKSNLANIKDENFDDFVNSVKNSILNS